MKCPKCGKHLDDCSNFGSYCDCWLSRKPSDGAAPEPVPELVKCITCGQIANLPTILEGGGYSKCNDQFHNGRQSDAPPSDPNSADYTHQANELLRELNLEVFRDAIDVEKLGQGIEMVMDFAEAYAAYRLAGEREIAGKLLGWLTLLHSGSHYGADPCKLCQDIAEAAGEKRE